MHATFHLQHSVTTQAQATPRTAQIAAMFGLGLDQTHRHTIVPRITLRLMPGQIVFATGVSGGGKSTLLRLIERAFETNELHSETADHPALVAADRLPPLEDVALVDALARPEGPTRLGPPAELDRVCHWLSRAGLNDAAVMLRRPGELSVGQRHRLQLAQAIAIAERQQAPWTVLLVDEFGSTLDRTTARALARSTRRWVGRSRICLVAATAHDDLLEPLDPDALVEVQPGGVRHVHTRASRSD